jgi:hypothetical protein
VTDKLVLFHNGIFHEEAIPTVSEPHRPDSYHLAKILTPYLEKAHSWLLDPAFIACMDELCKEGYPSKVCLLDAVYGPVLYNRAAWVDGGEGRLYSNGGPLFDPYDYKEYGTEEDWWAKNGDYEDIGPEWSDDPAYDDGRTWKDDVKRLEDLKEEAAYAHEMDEWRMLAHLRGR